MSRAAVFVALLPVALLVYAYLLYPLILWLLSRPRAAAEHADPGSWPLVTITLPIYNGGAAIRATLDRVLAVDYPRDRLQILVISDASTDETDEVVRSYEDRGVELLRLPVRSGKTAAENAAVARARGEIIVNVDATILVPSTSLKALIREFADPTVGVVSGRDVSVADATSESNRSESGYVGFEMWLRSLETTMGSIVGASGCFYGFRKRVHEIPLPPELSWDFASALAARELGYRSVSATNAICVVPRTAALRTELTRKIRTMARGLSTLFHKRALMNPVRFGGFALMLISHKLFRWIPYLVMPFAVVAIAWLAAESALARWVLAALLAGTASGALALRWPFRRAVPKPIALCGFILASVLAGFLAWVVALRGGRLPTWEPTPRQRVRAG